MKTTKKPPTAKQAALFKELSASPKSIEAKAAKLTPKDLDKILEAIDDKELPTSLLKPLLKSVSDQQFQQLLQGCKSLPRCLADASRTVELQRHLRELANTLEKEAKDAGEGIFLQECAIRKP